MKIQLIKDERIWSSVIRQFAEYDVYHTWEYTAAAEPEESEFCLLHVVDQDREFVLPVVRREVIVGSQRYFDLGSVYGYPGPILKGVWSSSTLNEVWRAVTEYLVDLSVICLVSRLNPFISNDVDFEGIGKVFPINSIVVIDLEAPEEKQLGDYRSNHRRDLKKLAKLGISCRKVIPDRLDDFIQMYNATMDRLNATSGYYFSKDYYKKLFAADSFCTDLYLCVDDNDVPVCGGIFFTAGNVIHYHLGATAESHLRLAPTKMLFDTVRRNSARSGLKTLNLGGGVGGQEDSLFRFKAGFSKSIFSYEMFVSIFDNSVYDQLLKERQAEAAAVGGVLQQNYYPEFRAPIVATPSEV